MATERPGIDGIEQLVRIIGEPDDRLAVCAHAALRPRCRTDALGRCVVCCSHYHTFSEE